MMVPDDQGLCQAKLTGVSGGSGAGRGLSRAGVGSRWD